MAVTARTSRRTDDGSEAAAALSGSARVLAILRYLAEHPSGSRLAEVAAALSAPKSTAHRGLAALLRAGFARQDADGVYHLSFDLLRLVFSYQEEQVPSLTLGPLLHRLAEHTGETTHYGVLVDGMIVYQAKVSPARRTLQMSSVIGGSNPAYRTGIGKALLMYELPDRVAVDRYVAEFGPLRARTPHTLTTPESLHAALEQGRERGYTLDLEENDLGIVCIALPLFLDSPARPSGAVSISAVATRTSADALVAQVDVIRRMIVEELGPEALREPVLAGGVGVGHGA
jgi:IclR family acetate operon transcriptional repressor